MATKPKSRPVNTPNRVCAVDLRPWVRSGAPRTIRADLYGWLKKDGTLASSIGTKYPALAETKQMARMMKDRDEKVIRLRVTWRILEDGN